MPLTRPCVHAKLFRLFLVRPSCGACQVIDAPEILAVIDQIPDLSDFLNALYSCDYKKFFRAFCECRSCVTRTGRLCTVSAGSWSLETLISDLPACLVPVMSCLGCLMEIAALCLPPLVVQLG